MSMDSCTPRLGNLSSVYQLLPRSSELTSGLLSSSFGHLQSAGSSSINEQFGNGLAEVDEQLLDCSADVYLSVCGISRRLGAAYYDSSKGKVFVLRDIADTAGYTSLQKLLMDISPTVILTTSKQDEAFIKCIKAYSSPNAVDSLSTRNSADLSSATGSCDRCEIKYLPPSAFSQESALRHLSKWAESRGDREKTQLFAQFSVDLQANLMVRSLGGLLRYIDLQRPTLDEACNVVFAFQELHMDDIVLVDEDTLGALQIFVKQFHPSVFKAGRGFKEGLSLYGMCNKCKSLPGAIELGRWLRRPLRNHELLRKRHQLVDYLMRDANIDFIQAVLEHMKHVKNITGIMGRMACSRMSVGDWSAVYNSLLNMAAIGDLLHSRRSELVELEIDQLHHEEFHRLSSIICKAAHFEEMRVEQRFVVRPGADADLDTAKRMYTSLPEIMTVTAQREVEQLPDAYTECSVIYLPMVGYMLTIPKQEDCGGPDDMLRGVPGLDYLFTSSNLMHYKSDLTREMDQELGDLKYNIIDRETSVMLRLQKLILEQVSEILDGAQLVAELDCLIALAMTAREHCLTRPEMVEENVIEIVGGWHPLQAMCTSPFVPNSTFNGGERYSKVKFLTGPNASGKSVYLKQVGIICYMALVGSFVPAESARIGLLDQIFSRIRVVDSIETGLSTFAVDLRQMSKATREATAHSLVIVDEFGQGTVQEVGVALLMAVLQYWLTNASGCPHVFVSTHLHALVRMLPTTDLLSYQKLKVLHQGSNLVFLFELNDGYVDCSYAHATAQNAGLPVDVLDRSDEVLTHLIAGEPLKPLEAVIQQGQLELEETVASFMSLDDAAAWSDNWDSAHSITTAAALLATPRSVSLNARFAAVAADRSAFSI